MERPLKPEASEIVFAAIHIRIGSAVNIDESTRLGDVFDTKDSLVTLLTKLRLDLSAKEAIADMSVLNALTGDNTVGDLIEKVELLLRRKHEPVAEPPASSEFTMFFNNKKTPKQGTLSDMPMAADPGSTRLFEVRCGSRSTPTETWVRVFYATDRKRSYLRNSLQYDSQRADEGCLSYGECTVSIPHVHRVGMLESPSLLKLEFRSDPRKHITLENTNVMQQDIFFRSVAESVARAPSKDAFVFVHGYSVSFEDAARRTGQIAFDLHFVGAPIFYSWPSIGKIADYIKDETNIAWSAPHFEHFLGLLAKYSGATRIHIIAHSMGNRAVCDALKQISTRPGGQLKFNHLVLAAPDIDADTFSELAQTLRTLSSRVTLYESSNDKAIKMSRTIHGSPRAGEPLLIIQGIDTIVASEIDTDFLGHSYFSNNWPLLSDIHSILFSDKGPADRFGLTEMHHPRGKYYAFQRS
jgi:esterase/lipase superfamily enzyme